MEELQQELNDDTPVWAIFGDLMSALVGVFVLILVWVLGYQVELLVLFLAFQNNTLH